MRAVAVDTNSGLRIAFEKRLPMNRPAIGAYRIFYRQTDRSHTLGIRVAAGAGTNDIPAIHRRIGVRRTYDGMGVAMAVRTGFRNGTVLSYSPAVPRIQIGSGLRGVAARTGDRSEIFWMRYGIGVPVTG